MGAATWQGRRAERWEFWEKEEARAGLKKVGDLLRVIKPISR